VSVIGEVYLTGGVVNQRPHVADAGRVEVVDRLVENQQPSGPTGSCRFK
jgi:hypothetical protein